MNIGITLIKYILFIFNLLCALCGIYFIAFGAMIYSKVRNLVEIEEHELLQTFAVNTITLGVLIFVISFFGCWGSISESYLLSMAYAASLFILIVLDIALVAFLFTVKGPIKEIPERLVAESWKTFSQPESPMHIIEYTFKCCGKNDASDYQKNDAPVNPACCGLRPDGIEDCPLDDIYPDGCTKIFTKWCQRNRTIIAYAGIIVILGKLVGFIFACCLADNIRSRRFQEQ